MAIIYSEHLKNRIKQRGFPDHYPKEIYDEPTRNNQIQNRIKNKRWIKI